MFLRTKQSNIAVTIAQTSLGFILKGRVSCCMFSRCPCSYSTPTIKLQIHSELAGMRVDHPRHKNEGQFLLPVPQIFRQKRTKHPQEEIHVPTHIRIRCWCRCTSQHMHQLQPVTNLFPILQSGPEGTPTYQSIH